MLAKRDNLIVIILLGVLVTGAMVFVYIPQGYRLSKIEGEIVSQKADLDQKTHEASVVPALVRQVKTMRARYHNIDRRLPKQKELGLFHRDITSLLAKQKISDLRVEPGKSVKEDMFRQTPIVIKFHSDFLTLAKLLEQINGMDRLTRVERLNIRPAPHKPKTNAKDKDKDPGLDIELQLNIYSIES